MKEYKRKRTGRPAVKCFIRTRQGHRTHELKADSATCRSTSQQYHSAFPQAALIEPSGLHNKTKNRTSQRCYARRNANRNRRTSFKHSCAPELGGRACTGSNYPRQSSWPSRCSSLSGNENCEEKKKRLRTRGVRCGQTYSDPGPADFRSSTAGARGARMDTGDGSGMALDERVRHPPAQQGRRAWLEPRAGMEDTWSASAPLPSGPHYPLGSLAVHAGWPVADRTVHKREQTRDNGNHGHQWRPSISSF
ncbi:uncharacterized protein LOC121143345 [Mesocricetus auratus]|uniref:Uncharacterized protein LOC121143345 n=1 Tax=Mesocricetus auratus TaxID=10036 RepID=A0ABM2Y8J7_MESAU|nr:uncharacterized protein LOC121143345 [Mesocricetus auratus]